MSKETKIKLVKDIDVTDIAGDKVIVDFETGKYYMLKGTAADIWENIQTETTLGALVDVLTSTYDVDEDTCLKGTVAFLNQMADVNFVTLS